MKTLHAPSSELIVHGLDVTFLLGPRLESIPPSFKKRSGPSLLSTCDGEEERTNNSGRNQWRNREPNVKPSAFIGRERFKRSVKPK